MRELIAAWPNDVRDMQSRSLSEMTTRSAQQHPDSGTTNVAAIDLNAGALAPVADEVDLVHPAVVEKIPRDLNGVWVRNGPDPLRGRFEGNDVLSWWPDAAMLRAISFQDGRVMGYRNRWSPHTAMGARARSGFRTLLVDTNLELSKRALQTVPPMSAFRSVPNGC